MEYHKLSNNLLSCHLHERELKKPLNAAVTFLADDLPLSYRVAIMQAIKRRVDTMQAMRSMLMQEITDTGENDSASSQPSLAAAGLFDVDVDVDADADADDQAFRKLTPMNLILMILFSLTLDYLLCS
jgi:hypothetical protein